MIDLRYCDTRRDLMGTFGHRNVGLGIHQIFDFSTLHKFDPVSFHKDIIIFAYYPFFCCLANFCGRKVTPICVALAGLWGTQGVSSRG